MEGLIRPLSVFTTADDGEATDALGGLEVLDG
jgi:hypothetical protein